VHNALLDASRLEEASGTGLTVTAESETRVTITFAINKSQPVTHRQFLEMLLPLTA
jgi:hypothetical protein